MPSFWPVADDENVLWIVENGSELYDAVAKGSGEDDNKCIMIEDSRDPGGIRFDFGEVPNSNKPDPMEIVIRYMQNSWPDPSISVDLLDRGLNVIESKSSSFGQADGSFHDLVLTLSSRYVLDTRGLAIRITTSPRDSGDQLRISEVRMNAATRIFKNVTI